MTIVFMNCLDQDDPWHDKAMRSHLGQHPRAMRQVSEETTSASLRHMFTGLNDWRQDLIACPRLDGEGNVLVVFICRKRRHRSVAARQLSHEAKDAFMSYFGAEIAPLARDVVAKSLCNQPCAYCNWNTHGRSRRNNFFQNVTANKEFNHTIDTWKG